MTSLVVVGCTPYIAICIHGTRRSSSIVVWGTHIYIHVYIYIYTYTSEFLHKTKPYPSKDIPAKDNTIPSKTGCHKTSGSCNAPARRRDLSSASSSLVGRTPYIDICLHGTRRLSYIVVWNTQIHNCKTPWYILESVF